MCSQADEYNQHDALFYSLFKGQKDRLERLGCLLPCSYTEYKVFKAQTYDFANFGFSLSFGSVVTTVRREYLIYPILSLVSDMGGSLGLFLGFCFFAMFDILKDAVLLVRYSGK